jgi:hypothetical protein
MLALFLTVIKKHGTIWDNIRYSAVRQSHNITFFVGAAGNWLKSLFLDNMLSLLFKEHRSEERKGGGKDIIYGQIFTNNYPGNDVKLNLSKNNCFLPAKMSFALLYTLGYSSFL